MTDTKWEVVSETAGSFYAEMVKGLLEAQGIPVMLSQEGAGHSVFALTVGPLGTVQVLVPADLLERAREILHDVDNGSLESSADTDFPPEEEDN